MNRLHKNVEYALIALNHMARASADELVSVKKLAVHINAPFDPLSRVMQKLARQSIIESIQGKTGGYRLNCDFARLSLYDLIKILQGPLEIVKCLNDSMECSMETNCGLKSPVTYLNEKLIEFYKTISIEELFSKNDLTTNVYNIGAAIV